METFQNPCPWQTIPDMLAAANARHSTRTAVVDGAVTLSYQQLSEQVSYFSQALAALGLGKGDSVCIWAPNSWRWIVSALSAWQLGAVVVPISSRLKAMEAGPILQRANTKFLLTVSNCLGDDFPAMLAELYGTHNQRPFSELTQLENVVCLDQKSKSVSCLDFDTLLEAAGAQSEHPQGTTGSSLCEILFTSGTTGEPKGVMLSHQQVLQAFWDWSAIGTLNENDRFLVIPPFSHGFGINAGILACIMRGMTHVVVDFFDPNRTLELIESHQITVMSGPPALFATIAQQHGNRQPGKLRVAYVGAAHVPEETIHCMQRDLGIDRVINAYGLIEACVVSMTRQDDSPEIISSSTGRPLPDVRLRIVDTDGRDCAPQDPGEILVGGYGVMQGYFNAPELTRDAISSDGWLATGDIGCLDEAGNLRIVGRKKEMFICNGFNVYPAEVEDLLLRHPDIAQVAVIGVNHPEKGEVGNAFVIPRADTTLDLMSIKQWARKNMATYKVPNEIFQVSTFPLNANGKVQKDVLKSMAESQTESQSVE